MRRFGLSQRIFLGFLCLSLSILVFMGVSLKKFSEVLDSSTKLQDTDDFLHAGTQLQDDLLQLVQTQEVFDQYLGEQTWRNYFEFSKRLETLLGGAKDTPTFRRRRKELEDLDKSRLEMSGLLANATFTINPNFTIGAVSPASLQKIKRARSQIHDQIREVLTRERGSRIQIETLLRSHLDALWRRMIVVVGLVFAGGILFAAYLHRAAMDPLRKLMEIIRNPGEMGIPSPAYPSGAREMRELIVSFNHLTSSLRQHQKRLSSMLSWAVMVAHEVRKPLAAIGTAIQVLDSGFPAEHPDKPIFREVLKEVYRVNGIISDLLVFSKPRPLVLEKIDWNDLIEEIRILLSSTLAERRINLELSIAPDAGLFHADRLQLHRALLNLLTNALDAVGTSGMSGAGAVGAVGAAGAVGATDGGNRADWGDKCDEAERAGGKSVTRGTVLLQVEPLGADKILVALEDSGPGIPPEDREKVFDPFFSRKSKGTGLGLAIVADIIERHDGHIKAMSGKRLSGARFEIELPRSLDSLELVPPGDEQGEKNSKLVQEKEHDRSSFG